MIEIPMIFWKYYDQYRRKLISIDVFQPSLSCQKKSSEDIYAK